MRRAALRGCKPIAVAAAAMAGVIACSSYGFAQAKPYDDWQNIEPAAAGFQPDVAARLDVAVRQGELPNLHAVVVVRGGKLVFERYYEGPDEFWAMPIGRVEFGPNVKHDLRSATKSMVSLLYGIAHTEGKVPALNQSLMSQFPAYQDLAADPERRRMTVAHALTMTWGLDWPTENLPTYSHNPELDMYLATDSYRFIFDRPMATAPGTTWSYCGGATAVLGHLIAQGTGEPLFQYAREKLFDPLGITEVQWVGGTDGEVSAPSGLRMRPRDFAKIGQMVLNKGRWGKRQVVPANWLEQALTPHASVPPEHVGGMNGIEYGYQWWLIRGSSEQPWFAAMGNGGQALIIIPSLDLVVAVMAGNYNTPNQRSVAMDIMNKIVLPALKGK